MDLPKLLTSANALPCPALSALPTPVAGPLGEREKAAGKPTAVVTADANDAQRLLDEIAFFAPTLRCALFPDWETLPYDTFSPHQDLISERLATLWRIRKRDKDNGADVVIVPATTRCTGWPRPAFWRATPFSSRSNKNSMKPSSRPSSRWRATATYRKWSAPANTRCAAG
jgi:transcription-repair coupling factor (superfamily II helicase)